MSESVAVATITFLVLALAVLSGGPPNDGMLNMTDADLSIYATESYLPPPRRTPFEELCHIFNPQWTSFFNCRAMGGEFCMTRKGDLVCVQEFPRSGFKICIYG